MLIFDNAIAKSKICPSCLDILFVVDPTLSECRNRFCGLIDISSNEYMCFSLIDKHVWLGVRTVKTYSEVIELLYKAKHE